MQHDLRSLTGRPNRLPNLRMKTAAGVVLTTLAAAYGVWLPAKAEDNLFHKTGAGLSVNIGLIPALAIQGRPAGDPMAPMPGGPAKSYKYHLVVAVFDAATKERIADAVVKARVSEIGLTGGELTLEKMKGADPVSYGGLVAFPSNARYVIAVKIERPGKPSVSLDFPYEEQAQ